VACARSQELELWEEDEDEFVRLLLPSDLVSAPLSQPPGPCDCWHGGSLGGLLKGPGACRWREKLLLP